MLTLILSLLRAASTGSVATPLIVSRVFIFLLGLLLALRIVIMEGGREIAEHYHCGELFIVPGK